MITQDLTKVSTPLVRSLEFERGGTHEACKGHVDPSDLIEHAEIRAQTLSGEYVHHPMYIATGRDRRRDVREELADARNHALWDAQEHLENDERRERTLRGLLYIALAYREFQEED